MISCIFSLTIPMQAEATLDDNDKNSQEKYELTMANDHFGHQNMSHHLDLGVNGFNLENILF